MDQIWETGSWEDRVTGAWMGLVVGDALGMPLTGSKEGTIQTQLGEIRDYVNPAPLLKGKSYRWSMPGLYGSIIQEALVFLETTLHRNHFDPQDSARKMVLLSSSESSHDGVWRRTGKGLRKTLQALKEGTPWNRAGQPRTDGEACGPALALSLSLLDASEQELLSSLLKGAFLTHQDPAAIVAATCVGCLVRDVLQKPGLAASELFPRAACWAEQAERLCFDTWPDLMLSSPKAHHHAMSRIFQALTEKPSLEEKESLDFLAAKAGEILERRVKRPTIGLAVSSVPYALLVAAMPGANPEHALLKAARRGGDVRTVCGIVGGISGVLYGCRSLPEVFLKGLANRSQIERRAEWLACGQKPSGMRNLVEMESALTQMEEERRQAIEKREKPPQPQKETTSSPIPSPIPLTTPPSKMNKRERRAFERKKTKRLRNRRK